MPATRYPIEARTWLPWAAVACLAALVAGLGELWILERMRARVLKDQAAIAEAALKSAENQLEAEHIVARSQRDRGPVATPIRVALLAAPEGALADPAWPRSGAVAWGGAGGSGSLVLSGAAAPVPGKAYQLWLEVPGGGVACGLVDPGAAQAAGGSLIRIPASSGGRFLLILGPVGGRPSLAEARDTGSIVLASLPPDGNISSLR
jgi:hypothetical protein